MNLCDFVNVLLSVTDRVYQDEANQEPGEYIVWTETSEKSIRADDSEAECAARINVMVYTDKPFSQIPQKLKKAWNANGIAYEDWQTVYDPVMKCREYSTFCEVT